LSSYHRLAQRALLVAVCTPGVALTACQGQPAPTEARSAPHLIVMIDRSASTADANLRAEHLDAVRSIIPTALELEAHLTVETFDGSVGTATVVVDETFVPKRQNAGNRKIERQLFEARVIKSTNEAINVTDVVRATPGSDPVGAIASGLRTLQADHEPGPKALIIATDGVQSTPDLDLATMQLTANTAASYVDRVAEIPAAPGVIVAIVGVGRMNADPQPPSSYGEGLLAFYRELCRRTGATCVVTTDPTVPTAVINTISKGA
jgi:hypothetical protein